MHKMKRAWYDFRRWLARWVPCSWMGVGFGVPGEMSSGELVLVLDVEGRTGNSYLSREMWERLGEIAGWIEVSNSGGPGLIVPKTTPEVETSKPEGAEP